MYYRYVVCHASAVKVISFYTNKIQSLAREFGWIVKD
jgi:hypothetical protein